jgi:hypothetical protein
MEQIWTINSDVDCTFTVSIEQVGSDFLKQPLTDGMRATNCSEIAWKNETKLNSMALVRKRTIPTERTPHVDQVNVNFCG